jgi:hypothetical protein
VAVPEVLQAVEEAEDIAHSFTQVHQCFWLEAEAEAEVEMDGLIFPAAPEEWAEEQRGRQVEIPHQEVEVPRALEVRRAWEQSLERRVPA